ncbi:EAL domain-containing protein [Pseudomonas sp. 5P_3.1_Bac2]|uniref:EAL domain-containing response regulator n=1 Tax=Pseudomonas sp. 5P_3.1_Bac2 TaxID=2971617 RepID=UPI0021CA01E4|nr:EAL domain-containing response regulator [Pseudomonas sp. 5P_3.1_Bac2]MCU1719429.1 EAL domain-containing protein [Pseudomonas sp. 5P_3.1_Bac2]
MSNGLPQHVLVIDDSVLQRQFTAGLCRKLGIAEVLLAEDGLDGIAQMSHNPQIEAIVLDLEMPGLDGVQVLNEMARLQLNPAVVVVSGRESVLLNVVQSMGHSLGLRLLGVLQKPISEQQLSDSLRRFAIEPTQAQSSLKVAQGPQLSEQDIVQALHEQQFTAYFQPKVRLSDGLVKGMEALARWQHPQFGVLSPLLFIEMVEGSPYISQLTLQMLDLALQHCQSWHSAGQMLTVSLNISAHSLADSSLADEIIARVSASGIAAQYLILEITEGALITDLGVTLGTLARLRLHGFGLSVDDYGTGFSSMLQLARVPCTELKVDRAFVNGASDSHQLRILLESALDIADKLGLGVVAEGVETLADWKLLRNLGCAEVQGFFIAKPMPGEQVLSWLHKHQPHLQALTKE